MSYEIEIKAHASEGLKEKIDKYCNKTGERVDKEDIYYAFPDDEAPRFRIRRENERLLVSAKKNHRKDGLECNEEVEFYHDNLADKTVMMAMASLLGYEIFIYKDKSGWSWLKDGVHIELLDVKHLGWFLEMEIISEVGGFEENRASYEKLYRILDDLGVARCEIEERSYQAMLRPFYPREKLEKQQWK